ncbi:MAG: putative manganese-dependent inorganic diphosphatase [Bacilli bacterium]|nr:putative manganese-dependent inorganic diphosphatase [Bacilli bacterium]
MQNVLVFGHKKPDTDAVTSAIALAELKNKLGIKAKPYVLGNINNETKFVLDYFKMKEPKYLNDVKVQIKDLNYAHDVVAEKNISIYQAYEFMSDETISTLPIVDNKKFIGAVSMKEIANYLVDSEQDKINTSYDNILNCLNGEKVLQFDNDIKGNVIFAAFKSTTFIETIKLDKDTILVLGDRHSIIEYAVEKGVKLIIITGNGKIKDEHLEIAKKNNVNIIKTPYLSYKTTRLLPLTNYVDNVINKNIITVNEYDYVDDFINIMNKSKRSNYPVINKNGECLGLIKYSNINEMSKKQVILVDHNEYEQSVDGLEEADIIEVVDHHKIGSASTSYPINFRNMPVGSTNTIVFKMYNENGIDIDKDIAGIMLAGIISDTLLFKSPTTTFDDIKAVESLAEICDIDYKEFASKMFEAGSALAGKSIEEIIFGDFKNFNVDNKKVGISQVTTTNAKEVLNNIVEYEKTIDNLAKINDYYVLALFVTDIINEGSYIIYSNNSKEIIEQSFNISNLKQGYYVENVVSRKKQIIPNIVEYIEKK